MRISKNHLAMAGAAALIGPLRLFAADIPHRREGGQLITKIYAGKQKFPYNGKLMFTPEGIEFASDCLSTTMTYPEIASVVGVEISTFKRLLRETQELAPYKQKHYEIVGQLKGPDIPKERERNCTHCGAAYTQYRNERGEWTGRRWCDQCVAERQTAKPPKTRGTMSPEELEKERRKRREYYQRNKEAEKQYYREYYTRNRDREIEKTRRNKFVRRNGLDPELWREQWNERRKEWQWIRQGKKALAKVRKHLSQKA